MSDKRSATMSMRRRLTALCERLAKQDVTHGFGAKGKAAGANQGNDDRFHAQSPIGFGTRSRSSQQQTLPWSSGALLNVRPWVHKRTSPSLKSGPISSLR